MLGDAEFCRGGQIGALRFSRQWRRGKENAVVRGESRGIREDEERNRAEIEVGDDLSVKLDALNLTVLENLYALSSS